MADNASTLVSLAGLQRYHGKLKDVAVGSIEVSGTTMTVKNMAGTQLATATLQDTTYAAASASADGLMSSGDYSKLDGIESGAQANVLESVSVNNSALTVTDKGVNIDLSGYALKTDITAVMRYKGTVAAYSALPTADQVVGDVYNITAADAANGVNAGDNVAWNGSGWDVLAGTFVLDTATNDQIDALFA